MPERPRDLPVAAADTGARLLCVKPTAPKRNSTFNRRVRYGGYTYYCKR